MFYLQTCRPPDSLAAFEPAVLPVILPSYLLIMNRRIRQIHYWLTLAIALPLAIVLSTGILLQIKKQWTWVQPKEQRGSTKTPTVDFATMLIQLQSCDQAQVTEWSDVQRIDIRPSKGIAKVTLQDGWEVQLDLADGKVLQQAIRRSDWIESIHDGSFFAGDWTKLGVFLPAAVVLWIMLLTGLWLFWLPIGAKRRKARRIAQNQ